MKEICPNLHNKQVAKEFGELEHLFGEKTAHLLWSRNNGYSIDKAPNGADSILFLKLLDSTKNRQQALIEKAKTYSNEFFNWFGDWTSDDKTDVSKVVDENGEPKLTYHGGAKDIHIFLHSTDNNTTTGSGYYIDETTGEKIPLDSDGAMFFSDNPAVGLSYQYVYAKNLYDRMLEDIYSLLSTNTLDGKGGIDIGRFKSIDSFYERLNLLSEINPRFLKFLNYLLEIRKEGKKLSKKEVLGFRSILLLARDYIKDNNLTSPYLINLSEKINDIIHIRQFLRNFNNDDGIKKLQDGIIPNFLKKEFLQYKNKEKNRRKNGLNEISNYEYAYFYVGDTLIKYDGKSIKLHNPYDGELDFSTASFNDIKEWLKNIDNAIKYLIKDIVNQDSYKRYLSKTLLYPVYLNIKNPLSHDYEGTSLGNGYKESKRYTFGYVAARLVNKAINEGYDGVEYLNLYDPFLANNYGVFNANLIKSAIGNSGEFSQNNNDIYKSVSNQDNLKYFKLRLSQICENNGRYLKSQYSDLNTRNNLLSELKSINPRISFRRNESGKWYWTLNGIKSQSFSIANTEGHTRQNVNTDKLFEKLRIAFKNTPELKLINLILSNYGQSKLIEFRYEKLDPGVAAEFHPSEDESEYYIAINSDNDTIFRNNSNLSDYMAQTILHELVHAFTYKALHNSLKLRKEAESLRQYLILKLGENSEYGLSNIYEMLAELTNVDFVNKIKVLPSTKSNNILRRVRILFLKIFKSIFGNNNSAYEDAVDILLKAVDSDRYPNMIDGIQDNATTTMKSISASQDKVDLIHKEITNLYQLLYKNYKKQLNKGTNKLKREDSLWSTIRDLLAKDKKEASSIAINLAFEQIGVYTLDPNIGVVPARRDTVLGYLQEQARTNFSNVTAGLIFDMKSNIIDFYNDLCKYLFDDKNNLDVQDLLNVEKLSSTVHEVNRLWREAANVVGDKIVEENVDKYINTNPLEAAEMKEVAKDWLHKNDMWGDESRFTMFFNYSRQDSPIIKLAFLMILDADLETRKQSLAAQQRLIKAYSKASSLVDKAMLGNWQTEFMERDKNGDFTGLFRSAVNRGLFKKDLEAFKQSLDEKWDKNYGYHYITDLITGETLRNDTMSSIENEVWNGSNPPSYVLYLRELENWICDHAHRRYSLTYYFQRLSLPYDIKTGKGHGLSPRTLSRLKYIQDQLNYILLKCSDKKTGLSYPERLSSQDYGKLQMWKDALQDLGNPFDMYGNRKSGEELQTALEIQAWNNWLADLTLYNTDYDAYDTEYKAIVDAINKGEKTQQDLYRFIDANSEWGINPEFLEYVFGNNQSQKDYVTRMFLNSIKRLVKTKNGYLKNFSDVIFNYNPDGSVSVPDMWGYSRLADIKNNELAAQDGIDPDEFTKNFDVREVPYTDPSGMYIAKDGVTKFNPNNNPNGLLPMSWFDFILKLYTDAAMDGRMDRFVSIDGSIAVDFSTFGGNRNKIEAWIAQNILMYEKTWEDKSGIMKSKFVPLSIFNQLVPKVATFGKDNKPTSRFIPKGRFTTKSSKQSFSIFDKRFSEDDRSGILPDFDLYGDKEFVNMIKKGGAKAEFYKTLLDTMEECWDKLGLDPSYNRYKLPLIEGTGSMKASRAFRSPKKYAKNKVLNMIEATSDDTDMRSNEDYVLRNGKWVLKTAPTRFINEMDDPSMISSDLAYTVGQFVLMTNNYLNKQKLLAKLETLGYNLNSENRDINHLTTGTRLLDRFEKMLKSLFYEQKETNENVGDKPGRAQIAASKAARMARSGTARLMLAYNVPSMLTGVWDSFTLLPAMAARGDLFNFGDMFYSMLHTFPNLFAAVANIGNPIANCKAVAMMQKDGLVKTSDESFKDLYKSRFRRALALAATGGYTMGDYMMNMLGQRCTYNAKKYYPGNQFIEEGFYTKNEFNRLMSGRNLTLKEINRDWKANHGESLWDAYYFDNGVAKLKDKYLNVKVQDSKLSAAIQLNMALMNGNAPKNDLSSVSNNILHKFFFLMRNFFIRRAEHWFAGWKPDNIVRKFEDITETTYRGSTTLQSTKQKKIPLTQELKSRRCAYDYSTGEANPAVVVNLLRGAKSQLAIFNQIMFHHQERLTDPRHINPNEARALREFITWGLCLALLSVGWMMFHRFAQYETKDLKPDTYEGSMPSINNFIELKVYLKLIDLVWFRVIDSQLQAWNPWLFVDMIKSATTVTSAVEKMGTIPSVGLDLIGASGHDFDEIITSDSKYKYFPRWQRALWTATPLNNILTWTSWRGNDKVGRWYFDNTVTGTMFKGGGYNWKEGNDEEDVKSERRESGRRDSERRESGRRDSERRN